MTTITEMFVMSDGVELYTRILLPEEGGRFPIVFQRTPYGARHHSWRPEACEPYLRRGYALVQQHVRGSGNSGGDIRLYCERQDGLDTLAILRTKPYYNGEIYVTGESYGATAHLCCLGTQPPDVKAAALGIQQDHMVAWRYRNGCCRNWCSLQWYLEQLQRRYPEQRPWQEVLQRPFVKMMERAVGEDVPEYTAMLLNDTDNDYWQSRENDRVAEQLHIPLLLLDGWFDYYIAGTYDMWRRLPEATRARSVFAVGPWGHSTRLRRCDYPLANADLPADIVARFFDHVRLGAAFDLPTGQVTYHTVTDGRWQTDADCRAGARRLYFVPGTLADAPGAPAEESYRYDPEQPLGFYRYDNLYRRPAETPEGVLTFLSEPAAEDTEIYGAVRWHMKVRSDCQDTAFFLRMYVEEDGESWGLAEAVTALSHQDPDYAAGDVCAIAVETNPVGFTWRKGSRIRVDISSHSDLYAPHANVRGHWAQVTETRVARNTVFMDEEAYIVLPVRELGIGN